MGRWTEQIGLLGVLRRALRISTGAQPASVSIEATAGIVKDVRWNTGQLNRWIARSNGDSESGANAGSNFEFHARADDGSLIGLAYSINRATQKFDFKVTPSINGVDIGTGGGGSSDAVVKSYAQTAHGLIIGQPVYWNGTLWVIADADSDTTMAQGFVSTVTDANNIIVTFFGRVTATAAEWLARTEDAANLVPGEFYWQSTVAGKITKTQPTSGFAQSLGKAESTTVFQVLIGPVLDLGSGYTVTGYPEGTANPSLPVTNQKFYRTDLNLLIYYDGTRWLTVDEYVLSNGSQAATFPIAAASYGYTMPVPTDYGIYLTRWIATTYVGATNNGSLYWTVSLEWTSAGNVGTSISTFNTSADTQANWVQHDQVINAVLNASAKVIRTLITKVSTPGTAHVAQSLYYRKIIT